MILYDTIDIVNNNFDALAVLTSADCLGNDKIFLQFKRHYPANYKALKREFLSGKNQKGNIFYYLEKNKLILNLIIKNSAEENLQVSDVENVICKIKESVSNDELRNTFNIALPNLDTINIDNAMYSNYLINNTADIRNDITIEGLSKYCFTIYTLNS